MSRISANRLFSLLSTVSMLATAGQACCAGEPVGAPPSLGGPHLMLYISQPLWSRGESARVFGLKLARPRPSDSTERGALIDIQLRTRSDLRVEFGRRVTWNVTRAEFGPSSSAIGFQMPTEKLKLDEPVIPPLRDRAGLELSASVVELSQRHAGSGALVEASIHSPWPLTESWNAGVARTRRNWSATSGAPCCIH